MAGAQCGGSESLWSKTAELALEQGHEVFVSVYKWDRIYSQIEALKNKGAIVDFRNRYNPALPFFRKLMSKLTLCPRTGSSPINSNNSGSFSRRDGAL